MSVTELPIQEKRGLKADLPILLEGQFGFCTDTKEVFIGDGTANNLLGAKGDTGLTGPKGDRGDAGTQGPKGDTGLTGASGAKGETGINGVKGDTGLTGSQGAPGINGSQGIQGIKGDTGAKGDTGGQGAKGDVGATGAPGTTNYNSLENKPSSLPANGGTANGMNYTDSRNTNFNGFDYKGITVHLKSNATDGLNDGGTYHGVLHITQWGDVSGGKAHELGFTDNGNTWYRDWDGSAWSVWLKIAKSTDIPTKLSQLTNDIGAGGGIKITTSPTSPTSPSPSDFWYKII
ncbi:hyaluronate lyase N-terminal domain-containing protein [Clostridium tagluense]|uniref:Major tropism determinant N-terminal domain-containing protein n=1 Tax=Clostridium tagluense TaxID=360422 RepID=A0A401UUA6_9CLOT|nr:collagen-like protein [Clostridium tagluense]GCD13132.1 hypothetical protein Ctaglu_47550 [Clostridium tagluense]